jgi:hypothetical protein
MIWNTVTMAWEAATGTLAGGAAVSINNFPASYPVTGLFATEVTLKKLVLLAPTEHDRIELGYTGTDLTSVVYKLAAATVATLTLTYDVPGGNLITVVKT